MVATETSSTVPVLLGIFGVIAFAVGLRLESADRKRKQRQHAAKIEQQHAKLPGLRAKIRRLETELAQESSLVDAAQAAYDELVAVGGQLSACRETIAKASITVHQARCYKLNEQANYLHDRCRRIERKWRRLHRNPKLPALAHVLHPFGGGA
jgi:multidrug resistance efflux pump